MGLNWLADAEPETCWAHHPWTDFASLAQREYAVAVLPVHGFAEHRAGCPVDLEELLGSHLLRQAVTLVGSRFPVRVLPPLRFVPAAAQRFFALGTDTADELVREIAAGVKAAGLRKLVFLNTSPAHAPFVNTAALDARVGLGLRTYVIQAQSLGLDLGRHEAGDAAMLAPQLAGLLTEIRAHLAPPLAPVVGGPVPSAAPVPAPFPAYRARYLPALSAAELAALPAADRLLVILPTGAIEQHGPHLPVGVDAILGQALLAATLPRLPSDLPVLVAPPLTYGKSNEHLGFPGTVTVSGRTLRRIVRAVAGQLQAWGVRRLALFNTHGGNSAVLTSLTREMPAGVDLTLLRPDTEPELDGPEAAWGFHAGEWETSLMLACAPELVHMDQAVAESPVRPNDPGALRPEHAPATFAWMTRDISRHGVIGNPLTATAEKGHRWMATAADRLAAKIIG